ncbi:MAG: hypothetical protein ABIE70_02280 [bacterium]
MLRRISTLIILSLLVVAFFAMTAAAASEYVPTKRVSNPMVSKVMQYALPYPDESVFELSSSGKDITPSSLGIANPPGSASPGRRLGFTWYDYQHNGTMGRQVTWGTDPVTGPVVHFDWMFLPTAVIANDRAYQYSAYINNANTMLAPVTVQPSGEYAGYVGIDVTKTITGSGSANKAVLAGHNNQGSGYSCHFYWDFSPAFGFFSANSRIPDATQMWSAQTGAEYTIWPTMRYQDVAGNTPVTHAFAQASMPTAADPQAVYYFRKVGANETGTWDFPPKIVDTIFDISQDVACSDISGKVALVWTANRCPDLDACDICSDNTGNEAQGSVQWDNDIYYMISDDFGASWNDRVNLTKNRRDEAGYRPYTDLSALITTIPTTEDLAIGWSGRVWTGTEAVDGGRLACRMFAWSEGLGFNTNHADGLPRGNIRTVADLNWDQTTCNGGSWQMNGTKMSISECNGKLYFLWVQFNDIPNGVEDDCAQRGIDGSDVVGAANGELFLSVSNDRTGLLWDGARNLTNSYTPGCDSASGLGGRCDSDHWPSMARYGSNLFTNVHDSIKVDPSGGSYTGGYYLPVEYIADQTAGGIVQDEGTWQPADVVWFQLACVDPVPTKSLTLDRNEIAFPEYCKPNATKAYTIVAENTGNANLTANYSVAVTSGHPGGSITFQGGASGSISVNAGLANTLPTTLSLANGLISAQGELTGTVTFSGDFIQSPLVFPISFWIADTIIFPEFDTLYADDNAKAPYLALTIGNNGNMGNQGVGHVNLDYFDYGDCDVYDEETEDDPYPGDASIYLYDGSKVICWYNADADSIECNYSMFDHNWLTGGFFPGESFFDVAPGWITGTCAANIKGAQFFTRDTSIMIEQYIFAPTDVDNPQFMVQAAKFTNLTASTITGLAIGEAIDWDIPSDSASWNNDGFDFGRQLMYQVGGEYDAVSQCQANDRRYGGLAVKDVLVNGASKAPWGLYCMDNATQVYPLGHFDEDSLWNHMEDFAGYTSADSTDNDLHMVVTFGDGGADSRVDLAPGDEYIVVTVMVTGKDGEADFLAAVDEGLAWADCLFGGGPVTCCLLRADINHDGVGPDIGDLVYLVNYMFNGGPPPPCNDPSFGYMEADVNGDGVGPDIGDLVYLVNYMFNGGPAPVPCP